MNPRRQMVKSSNSRFPDFFKVYLPARNSHRLNAVAAALIQSQHWSMLHQTMKMSLKEQAKGGIVESNVAVQIRGLVKTSWNKEDGLL
ncbi:hypothetical protein Q3G72_029765 [Acer saccharum]|nr:hypothetical protein Q3G72_017851 [Acer saccharum]KAK1557694.1 hypothetical protein Q3G72_029765 [Acer saccharum]